MLGTVVDLINSFFLGAFLSTGTLYFLASTSAHRAAEAVHREHAAMHRAARQALERALRDNT